MSQDGNKGTVSSLPSVIGEFKVTHTPTESTQDKFEFLTRGLDSTAASTGFNIAKIAPLVNLSLNDQESKLYSRQISEILTYVNQLNKVDITNVEPTFNVTGQSNVMSEDETAPSLSQEESLLNASKKKDNMFETKGVFEEE